MLSDNKDRIAKLNETGIVRSLQVQTKWDERFDELVVYKEKFGDFDVPTICKENYRKRKPSEEQQHPGFSL
jgi:hypothetical protein